MAPTLCRNRIAAAAALAAAATPTTATTATPAAAPIPSTFEGRGSDRQAIEALLATYMRAVSTKDEALFETLLLARDIPFSDAETAARPNGGGAGTRNYDGFRRDVFAGPPFTQRFRDIHIEQDGVLAQVSLVFVNTAAIGSGWGWKTMQLLKVDGQWKIASEFYTWHDG